MTSTDEYQWRYRRPARSLHESFAEMAASCSARWRRRCRLRRALVASAALLLIGLAVIV